jgi:hypothetical protein
MKTVQYAVRRLATAVELFVEASSKQAPNVAVWVPSIRTRSNDEEGNGRDIANERIF